MFTRSLNPQSRGVLLNTLFSRLISSSVPVLDTKGGNLFGALTRGADVLNEEDPSRVSNKLAVASQLSEKAGENSVQLSTTVENDTQLQKYIVRQQQPIKLAPGLLLSPLKRKIYEANCRINGGFYKQDTVVKLPSSPVKYKLKLSKEEVEVLEPSVYVKSYRIKSSMKKATVLLRLLNGLGVKQAMTQCHFSDKKVARDVSDLLKRGIEDGERLGLKADDLYIAQIWTGSDGYWPRRIDIKGRGRNGKITHPYVHVRCILKTKSVTKRRLEYEQQQKLNSKKPWVQLADKPIRGTMGGVYKW